MVHLKYLKSIFHIFKRAILSTKKRLNSHCKYIMDEMQSHCTHWAETDRFHPSLLSNSHKSNLLWHAGSSVNSIHDKSNTSLIIRHPPIEQLGKPGVVVLRDASFWHDLPPSYFKYTHLNTIKWISAFKQLLVHHQRVFGWTFNTFKNTAFILYIFSSVFSRRMVVLVWTVVLQI